MKTVSKAVITAGSLAVAAALVPFTATAYDRVSPSAEFSAIKGQVLNAYMPVAYDYPAFVLDRICHGPRPVVPAVYQAVCGQVGAFNDVLVEPDPS